MARLLRWLARAAGNVILIFIGLCLTLAVFIAFGLMATLVWEPNKILREDAPWLNPDKSWLAYLGILLVVVVAALYCSVTLVVRRRKSLISKSLEAKK